MVSKKTLQDRIEFRKRTLDEMRSAYLDLIAGRVKSYTIGSRSLTRFDLKELDDLIKQTEKEIDSLESQLAGGKPRKAVGVVPRDW